jgi:hypothetical protein
MSKKQVLRSTFDKLSQKDRMEHCLSGGSVVDDAEPPSPSPPLLAANQKLRLDFDRMAPRARMEWVMGGGNVVG